MVPSGADGTSSRLARELTVALADARVNELRYYTIDPARPDYDTLPEWRRPDQAAGPAETSRRPPRDRATARRHRRAAQFRRFGDPATTRVPAPAASGLEPVGTITERLRWAVAGFREAVETRPERVAVGAVSTVALLLSAALAQLSGSRAPEAAGEDLYLWLHAPRLGLFLVGAAAIWATAAGVAEVTGGQFAPWAVVQVWRAVTIGVLAGGYARLQISRATLVGLLVFALIGVLWKLAERVTWRMLSVGLRVTTVAVALAVVAGYGRARLVFYYAGMGVHASEVDTAGFETFTVAVRPALSVVVTVALLLGVAWIVSGWWTRFAGAMTTILALLTARALLLTALGDDERRGRRVGAGLAQASPGSVRFDPAPTAMCLTSVAAEPAKALTDPLPRPVWTVGRSGQQTLLLDPEKARASHSDLPSDPAARATYVPPRNVAAPVWYVPTSQITLRRAEPGASC